MPLSRLHKIIFIHIPKTAGTSIIKTIPLVSHGHKPPSFYKSMGIDLQNYFVFTIVRHPLDRFVSSFEFARAEKSYYHSADGNAVLGVHCDYEALKDKTIEQGIELLFNNELTHSSWIPQYQFLFEGNDPFVINRIFHFENLHNEIKELYPIVGRQFDLPVLNVTPHENYRQCLSKDLIDRLHEFYNQDFKFFNYT